MARDYLKAISERVVVYDGGMGATLEQFELTSEDYGGLPGKCHEALVLNRPDVMNSWHAPMRREMAEAIDHLDEIIATADAVMVARGDLGVEMPAEKVPVIQKYVIRRAADWRKRLSV